MKLTGILQEIADAAGTDAALKIAKAKGGTNVYFPGMDSLDGRPDCWLKELVGEEAARKISWAFPISSRIDIPLGPFSRNAVLAAEIERRLEAGESVMKVARALGCSSRTVLRRRAHLREQARAASQNGK